MRLHGDLAPVDEAGRLKPGVVAVLDVLAREIAERVLADPRFRRVRTLAGKNVKE